jgi:hypothetical protein
MRKSYWVARKATIMPTDSIGTPFNLWRDSTLNLNRHLPYGRPWRDRGTTKVITSNPALTFIRSLCPPWSRQLISTSPAACLFRAAARWLAAVSDGDDPPSLLRHGLCLLT